MIEPIIFWIGSAVTTLSVIAISIAYYLKTKQEKQEMANKKKRSVHTRVRITEYIGKEYSFFVGMTGDLVKPLVNKSGVIACVRLDSSERLSGIVIEIYKEYEYEVI